MKTIYLAMDPGERDIPPEHQIVGVFADKPVLVDDVFVGGGDYDSDDWNIPESLAQALFGEVPMPGVWFEFELKRRQKSVTPPTELEGGA